MIAAVLLWVVFLELAGGEGVVIPSETTCTRHPPAQQTIDATHLTELPMQKGIITRQEVAS